VKNSQSPLLHVYVLGCVCKNLLYIRRTVKYYTESVMRISTCVCVRVVKLKKNNSPRSCSEEMTTAVEIFSRYCDIIKREVQFYFIEINADPLLKVTTWRYKRERVDYNYYLLSEPSY